jgi:hypothetical protein
MGAIVEMIVYVLTAGAFLWLTWRTVLATVPSMGGITGIRHARRPALFWLSGLFYGAMACFEVAFDMGL